MRITFLILMHKNPDQAKRLIQRLEGPFSTFVVHIDRRAPDYVVKKMHEWAVGRNDIRFAARYSCYWANFGIVAGTLACMRTALDVQSDFDYAVLLSGQDYPIKPLRRIFDYLKLNYGKQFIETFRLDEGENRWSQQGGQFQAAHRFEWRIMRFRSKRIAIPLKRKPPAGLVPCGGSQWWCLSSDAVSYVVRYLDDQPKVSKFFKHVSVPDETVFQTLIYNSPFRSCIMSDDLHFADWDRPEPPYPRIFDFSDLGSIRQAGKLFARKFDTSVDTKILDLIDQEILFRNDIG